ncbi:MAG: hypothetical protein N3G80_03725 [Candidatus Micrarchaeota archaeon]|nr:hypothetical protein [Candidatus Micrarchaeota archaeon]
MQAVFTDKEWKDYAEKLEMLLKCKQKADSLHAEYLEFLEKNGIERDPKTAIRNIRKFLREEKKMHVEITPGKTPSCGSSCLELSVAAVLLAKREKVDARVVLFFGWLAPFHYRIQTHQDFEITGLRLKIQHSLKAFRWVLTPESVARHVKVIDSVAKGLKLMAFLPGAHSIRNGLQKGKQAIGLL